MADIVPQEKSLYFVTLNSILPHDSSESTLRDVARSIKDNPILETVNLCSIRNERAGDLLQEAVLQNRNVKELSISNITVDLKRLCLALRQMPKLESLGLFDFCVGRRTCQIQNADGPTLNRLFTSNRRLKEICLHGFQNGDAAAAALARSLSFRSSLKRFAVSFRRLSRSGMDAISQALQQPSCLEYLSLSTKGGVFVDNDMATTLARGIQTNTSLIEIEFSFDQMDPQGFSVLMRSLPRLKRVRWHDLKLVGPDVEAVAGLIASSSGIEHLSLSGTLYDVDYEFSDDEEEIDTTEAGIDVGPILLALGSNSSLKTLVLSDWVVRVDGTAALDDNGSYSNSTLETLDIAECDFEPNSILALGRYLERFSGLKSIRLFSRRMMANDEAATLCKALECNKLLETFGIAYTPIDVSAQALAQALSGLPLLKDVTLQGNNLTDDGFASIGTALKRFKNLRNLSLLENDNVGERGTRAILDGMKENYSLVSVWFPGDKLSPLQEDERFFYLTRNHGPKLLLSESIPLGLWPHALERAGRWKGRSESPPALLHYLVSEKHVELLSNHRQDRRRRGRKRKRGSH